jgi:hypothetical protein
LLSESEIVRSHCVLVICVAVAGCFNLAGEWREEEVGRVTNPGGVVDAVLSVGSAGATTSSLYKVYIVPRRHVISFDADSAAASFDNVTRSDSVSREIGGVNLRWVDSATLHIEYIYSHHTRVRVPFVLVGSQPIHIVLQKGVAKPPAPSGGTVYDPRVRTR